MITYLYVRIQQLLVSYLVNININRFDKFLILTQTAIQYRTVLKTVISFISLCSKGEGNLAKQLLFKLV